MSFLKKLSSRNSFIIALVLVGVLAGFALAYLGFSRAVGGPIGLPAAAIKAESPEESAPADIKAAMAQAEGVQSAFRYVAKQVQPAIVEVNVVITKTEQASPEDQFPWPFFFGNPPDQKQAPQQYKEQGLGSGIIVRRAGGTYYVLTNNHVAGSADKITVITNDGKEYKGSLVGKDARKDLALVKFESDNGDIAVATLGDSSALQVGDWAIAIGSPLGLVSSVTAGIVSALGRTGGPDGNISDFIQTDAAINRGNSGGALVNIHGEVVGINTWIASPSGGSIGLGFAIPINNAKKAIDDFISYGKVEYGWLGASLRTNDRASALEIGAEPGRGGFVIDIFRQSPAEKGGLYPGDVVLSVNGTDIKGVDQLVRLVGDLPAGREAEFSVLRDGKTMSLKITIEPRKASIASNNGDVYPGVDVVSINSENLDKSSLPKGVGGVVVANVLSKSPAAIVGLQQGDVVTGVNDKSVRTVRDFYRYLNDASANKVSFTVVRDGQTLTTLAFSKK